MRYLLARLSLLFVLLCTPASLLAADPDTASDFVRKLRVASGELNQNGQTTLARDFRALADAINRRIGESATITNAQYDQLEKLSQQCKDKAETYASSDEKDRADVLTKQGQLLGAVVKFFATGVVEEQPKPAQTPRATNRRGIIIGPPDGSYMTNPPDPTALRPGRQPRSPENQSEPTPAPPTRVRPVETPAPAQQTGLPRLTVELTMVAAQQPENTNRRGSRRPRVMIGPPGGMPGAPPRELKVTFRELRQEFKKIAELRKYIGENEAKLAKTVLTLDINANVTWGDVKKVLDSLDVSSLSGEIRFQGVNLRTPAPRANVRQERPTAPLVGAAPVPRPARQPAERPRQDDSTPSAGGLTLTADGKLPMDLLRMTDRKKTVLFVLDLSRDAYPAFSELIAQHVSKLPATTKVSVMALDKERKCVSVSRSQPGGDSSATAIRNALRAHTAPSDQTDLTTCMFRLTQSKQTYEALILVTEGPKIRQRSRTSMTSMLGSMAMPGGTSNVVFIDPPEASWIQSRVADVVAVQQDKGRTIVISAKQLQDLAGGSD